MLHERHRTRERCRKWSRSRFSNASALLFFLLPLLSLFLFLFPTSESLNPSPTWLFIGKNPFWGRGSPPRRASCLGTKPFHGPSELDASLGLLGSRKIQKKPFCPIPWYPFVFLIKTLSDSLLRTVTGSKYCNSTSKNQNIISNDISLTKLGFDR